MVGKTFRRLLGLVLLFMFVALIRAERGVAELRGHERPPAGIARLSHGPDDRWHYSVLGWQGRVPNAAELKAAWDRIARNAGRAVTGRAGEAERALR